jgi:hypothetical protein
MINVLICVSPRNFFIVSRLVFSFKHFSKSDNDVKLASKVKQTQIVLNN